MAEGTDNSSGGGAFRALQRGFVHWSCGRLDHIEVNVKHPRFCHIRCKATPSMKSGLYQVTLLLGRDGDVASICRATCECAAGYANQGIHLCISLLQEISILHTRFGSATLFGYYDSRRIPVTFIYFTIHGSK